MGQARRESPDQGCAASGSGRSRHRPALAPGDQPIDKSRSDAGRREQFEIGAERHVELKLRHRLDEAERIAAKETDQPPANA
jgi:hypothetical protein